MACSQSASVGGVSGSGPAGGGGYATEADCLQACKEGACCFGSTCQTRPQCECASLGGTFKGVGTTCSPNPCYFCQCAAEIPDYVDVSFSDFSLTYNGSTNNLTDMSGYSSQLKTFLESLSPRFAYSANDSAKGLFAAYRYYGGCYENNTVLFNPSLVQTVSPCETVSGCSDSSTLLDTSSYGTMRLYCDGRFNLLVSMRSPVGCWASFPQNRQNHTLYYRLQGAGASGSLNVCGGSLGAFSSYPASQQSQVQSYANWSMGVYTSFSNVGYYMPDASAKINYTPHYANPLP